MSMSPGATDSVPEVEHSVTVEEVSLAWSSTVARLPLALGGTSEATVVDWSGRGEPDLLVTLGDDDDRRSYVHRRADSTGDDDGLLYDGGTLVEELDGYRCIRPIRSASAGRFDLLALSRDGLVRLPNIGESDSPRFGPASGLGVPPDLGVPGAEIAQFSVFDWDGDGLDDLLVGLNDLTDYWPDQHLPVEQRVGLNQRGGHPGFDRRGNWRGRPPLGRVFWLKNVGKIGEPRFEAQGEIGPEQGLDALGVAPAPLSVCWGGGRAPELLVADRFGPIRIYRNFGGQLPPILSDSKSLGKPGKPSRLPEDRTTISVGDIDGDRRPELIFGSSDGRVFYIRSEGSRESASDPIPLHRLPGALSLGAGAVLSTADLDGDLGLDLVYGDAAGRLYWLKDVGNGNAHRYERPLELLASGEPYRMDPGLDGLLSGPVSPPRGYACPCVVDWTGNGRPDLIVGGAGGEVLLFRNDGAVFDPRFEHPTNLKRDGGPLITPPRVRPAVASWFDPEQKDLISLDLQGFLCVYPRRDALELGDPLPLTDRLGRYLRLDGGFGQAGRCSLWAGDWRGSGKIDLLVGLPKDARHVVPGLLGKPAGPLEETSTVLLLENLGKNMLVPRELRRSDGRPLILGVGGCSPNGVSRADGNGCDLVVGSDDGSVIYMRREELTW